MSRMCAVYHLVFADNPTGLERCQSYIDDMQRPWYQSRYRLFYHRINGLHHTFLIARNKFNNKRIDEVGVQSLREEMKRG